MIKHGGEVNPLNVFDLREVPNVPPHFTKMTFDLVAAEKDISNWIYENMEGRFFLSGSFYSKNDGATGGRYTISACVAFELPSEATYFSMMLPSINIPRQIM